MANVTQTYATEFQSLKNEPLAWLSANYKTSQNAKLLKVLRNSCLNACAWDGKYYYFISYKPGLGPEAGSLFGVLPAVEIESIFGAYSIPVDSSGGLINPLDSSLPPSGVGVTKLAIPGVP